MSIARTTLKNLADAQEVGGFTLPDELTRGSPRSGRWGQHRSPTSRRLTSNPQPT